MLVYEVEEIQLSTGPTHRTEAPDLTEEVGQLFHVFLASKVLQLPKKKRRLQGSHSESPRRGEKHLDGDDQICPKHQ